MACPRGSGGCKESSLTPYHTCHGWPVCAVRVQRQKQGTLEEQMANGSAASPPYGISYCALHTPRQALCSPRTTHSTPLHTPHVITSDISIPPSQTKMSTLQLFLLIFAGTVGSVWGQCTNACPLTFENDELCVGDALGETDLQKSFSICHPSSQPNVPSSIRLASYKYGGSVSTRYITVVANHYTGCNAGRREAMIYAAHAEAIAAKHPNVIYLASLKGGGSCSSWAEVFAGGLCPAHPPPPTVHCPLLAPQPCALHPHGLTLRRRCQGER